MKKEEKFQIIYEHLSEGIAVIQEGYVVFLNPKMMQISGFTWKELTQWPAINFIHRDHKKIAADICGKNCGGDDDPVFYKLKICLKDKSVKTVNAKINRVTWEGSEAFLVFINDEEEKKSQ